MLTMNIKRGDTVKVITGRDRGKQGKVVRAMPARQRLLVEGLNLVKRHVKARSQKQKGGIIEKEAGIHVSNVVKIAATD
jgi:large subunit ribosomal protein L24